MGYLSMSRMLAHGEKTRGGDDGVYEAEHGRSKWVLLQDKASNVIAEQKNSSCCCVCV